MVIGCKLRKDVESPNIDHKKYRSMIGGLLYLTTTGPNIMHVVCLVSRFQADPKEAHVTTIKRMFRYLKGTPDYGLWYPKSDDFTVSAYTYTDWTGCVDD